MREEIACIDAMLDAMLNAKLDAKLGAKRGRRLSSECGERRAVCSDVDADE
jgi:hypothetical protein